jgi:hypothetical protein
MEEIATLGVERGKIAKRNGQEKQNGKMGKILGWGLLPKETRFKAFTPYFRTYNTVEVLRTYSVHIGVPSAD